jgi:hypothetical protein
MKKAGMVLVMVGILVSFALVQAGEVDRAAFCQQSSRMHRVHPHAAGGVSSHCMAVLGSKAKRFLHHQVSPSHSSQPDDDHYPSPHLIRSL